MSCQWEGLLLNRSGEHAAHDPILEQDEHDINWNHTDQYTRGDQPEVNRALVGPKQGQGKLDGTVVWIHQDLCEQIFIPDIDEIQNQDS